MKRFASLLLVILLLTACMPPEMDSPASEDQSSPAGLSAPAGQQPSVPLPTPLPTRAPFAPGTLVDYIAQTGDTLPTLAVRFNTTVAEIRAANPIIPGDATTMPPGMPMKIPIYYLPMWGSPYQIIPDSLFIDGPEQIGFKAGDFVRDHPGWLKDFRAQFGNQTGNGGDLVDYIASLYSVSPRLLLALIEYQAGGLTQAETTRASGYTLGYPDASHKGLSSQLNIVANLLNNVYYEYRLGRFTSLDLPDGRLERPDPWQNAATVALRYFFSKTGNIDEFTLATSGEGLAKTYKELFGDPWANVHPHIPGSLRQPDLRLPFLTGNAWAYTGGPHTGWGEGDPLSAIDFAPPSIQGGCTPAADYATAVADGIVYHTDIATAQLDLDGDGDLHTGWVIFYLHLADSSIIPNGTKVKVGDPIGLPSCEGGKATGTHVHIARKYNGEWIPAGEGVLAFNLEGWVAANGTSAYQGTLFRFGKQILASTASGHESQIIAAIP